MPLISTFLGILIYLYKEDGAKHNKPHVHARYGGQEISIAWDGEVLAGNLPHKQRKAVETWVAYHDDEIKAAWIAYNEHGQVVKIRGLEV